MSQKKQSSNFTVQESNNGYSETLDKPQTEQLIEQHPVPETPFTIIKYADKWFLSMGKYRLTEPAQTREEIENLINDTSWNRITQVIMTIVEEMITPLTQQIEILKQQINKN